MSMAAPFRPHRPRVSPSWLGVALAVLHCSLLVFFAGTRPDIGPPLARDRIPTDGIYIDPYNSSSSVIAGRLFHFAHEPVVLKAVYLLDLPALFLSVGVGYVALKAGVGPYTTPWVGGLSWLAFGTLQWLLIGSIIGTRRRSRGQRTTTSASAA